jgi:hypothetical protein
MKIQTPIESIKYFLESYCYADLDPFINPTNMFLNSLKNQEESQVSQNYKNLKLIVDTRVAHVFLERRVADTVKMLLSCQALDSSIKGLLINGLSLAGKNPKQKQVVIAMFMNKL